MVQCTIIVRDAGNTSCLKNPAGIAAPPHHNLQPRHLPLFAAVAEVGTYAWHTLC
jgi:hypothetical protein